MPRWILWPMVIIVVPPAIVYARILRWLASLDEDDPVLTQQPDLTEKLRRSLP